MITKLYPVTEAKAHSLRTLLVALGAKGARVRKMRNGAARVVLADAAHRAAACSALTLAEALTACGQRFDDPAAWSAWNGPVEIFVRFAKP